MTANFESNETGSDCYDAYMITTTVSPRMKPFLKWAGGKTQLLPELLRRVPGEFSRYIEPFVGGGALFFALGHRDAVLCDANPELINCYEVVRDSVDDLMSLLTDHVNEADYFYQLRASNLDDMSAIERASRFIFLNRTCFNGLYRVNARGQFNTPFGRYTNPRICDETALRSASEALVDARLVLGDYRVALAEATVGDFVYLDPPYVPVSKHADFKRYTKDQFREADQLELAVEFRRLADLGCHVMLSNSWHPLVEELYAGYTIDIVEARRLVNCDASKRGPVQEAIVRNYE